MDIISVIIIALLFLSVNSDARKESLQKQWAESIEFIFHELLIDFQTVKRSNLSTG